MNISMSLRRHLMTALVLLALPALTQAQFTYVTNSDAVSVTITGYTGPGGTVVIPNTINGYAVTSIGGGAFFGSTSLGSVIIPPGITNIGDHAFETCVNLANLTIPGSVTSIGQQAFFDCYDLTNVAIPPGVIDIGDNAFLECFGLTNVTISSTVTNIGDGVFQSCVDLISISVAPANPNYSSLNGVLFDKAQDTLIDYPAGIGNSYTIPNSVTSIGDLAFYYCLNVTNVTFPDSLISIGDYAFAGDGLISITMPRSVTSIGINALADCTALASAYFPGDAPFDGGDIFLNDTAAIVYYLPGTSGWSSAFGDAPTQLWYQSQPQVLTFEPSFGVQNNQFGFTISWATNASVIVLASTNLANPNWIPVTTNALAGGTNYFTDPQWMNYPNRFYRISGL